MRWALILLLISGCSTDAGKRTTGYAVADIGSTGIALTVVEGAAEANPLGWGMIPLKFWLINRVDKKPCVERKNDFEGISAVWGGAAVNNAALLIYPPAAIPIGIIGGLTIYHYENKRGLHDCVEELVADLLYFTDVNPGRVRVTTVTTDRPPDAIWDNVLREWRHIPPGSEQREDI